MAELFGIATGLLGDIAAALISGEQNIIEKLILDKVRDLGKTMVEDLVGEVTPYGEAKELTKRLREAVESGGRSEFKRARDQWLNALKKPFAGGTSLQARMHKVFQDAASAAQDAAQDASRPAGSYWQWSRSRREWLHEDWRHDWRSQPRDRRGRWIPGRLNTIYMSRATKKRRRMRRKFARRTAKELARELVRGN